MASLILSSLFRMLLISLTVLSVAQTVLRPMVGRLAVNTELESVLENEGVPS
jgi:hypothetical protein